MQPPLDEVPEGDWYCPTCVSDGKAGKAGKRATKQKAARQATPSPAKKAALLGDDEDDDMAEADGGVTMSILDQGRRWAPAFVT